MRRLTTLILVVMVLIASLGIPGELAVAATFRNHVAQAPETPTSAKSVRVWMQSDTAFGETAGIEYNLTGTGTYVKVLGTFDTSGPAPANWRADIPAHPHGTQIQYQLFTRNEHGSDYGFTGFNWNYTVNDGDIQWDGLRHDTFDSYYRSPFGAVPAGSSVRLRFRTIPFDVDGVSVRVYHYDPASNATSGPVDYPLAYLEDRVEDGTNYAIWTYILTTPGTPAILYYKFRISDGLDVDWYSDAYADDHDNLGQGGEGATSEDEPFPSFQITVYQPGFQTPEWLKNANVYQIFPDRFRNGDPGNDYCREGSTTGCPGFYDGSLPTIAHTTWNQAIHDPRQPGPYFNTYGTQFFGGDLNGIQERLDYLQSLGIDTLFLNPIFKARSNHRYDTDDFLEIDLALGGEAALESLVEELERRGMYLILDGVFNHTSSDSLYFDRYDRYAHAGACESLASPYRSWFRFFNNNLPCGSSDYEGWFGFDSLAVLTDGSSAVRDFFYRAAGNVTQYWYQRGASGWRFDVADEITHDWWRDYRPSAKGYKSDGPLVGEVWYDASRFLLGEQLDSVMNYRFRKNVLGFARGVFDWGDNDNNGSNRIQPLSPSQFDHALRAVREDYPPQATAAMLNLIDSHDTNRALYVLTFLGDNGLTEAKERLKLSALFQFTYPGAPMVYYGDEAAIDAPSLANGPNGPEDDPYNRAPYPWTDEAGDQDFYGPADANMIGYYSRLAHLRMQHPALRSGSFETLLTGDTTPSSSDNSTYAFARVGDGEKAVVALNNGASSNTASIPVGAFFADGTVLQDALGGATYTVSGGSVSVSLPARSGVVLFPFPAGVDTTSPGAGIGLSPAANPSGWHNTSPVTANLSGSDSDSGVKELRYWVNGGDVTITPGSSANLMISAEGNTSVFLRSKDQAGNISPLASQVVKIDLTPPVVSVTGVTEGAIYALGSVPVAGCSTEDALSGVAAEAVINVTGGSPDGIGTFTATCSGGTDQAGNTAPETSVSYTVTPAAYNFTGFFPPVDNLPVLNVAKAGSAIPVKFSLGGDQGLDIFDPGYPKSQTIACSVTDPVSGVEETVNAGASSLSYDPGTNQYTYVWKTDKKWANTCRQLMIKLNDGTEHRANFMLSK